MRLHALTPTEEIDRRIAKLQEAMRAHGMDAMLISDNADIYYTSGRVFSGYVYIPANGEATYFIRRPEGITDDRVKYIRKPEQIAELLSAAGAVMPAVMGYELSSLDVISYRRLVNAFPGVTPADASPLIKSVRSVKTDFELEQLRQSGIKHQRVYDLIPRLYKEGMTDIELQIEIERASRLEGCLGIFRIAGDSMEFFMSNILAGDNADSPTPYDFAMGGAGLDPSLPVGADGTVIRPGMSVMVDSNGNFTGYMTDMTRVFACGQLDDKAMQAHECSIEICRTLEKAGKPGTPAAELYETAMSIVRSHDLERYFMGHKQKAGVIGHGVGIEINELPVIAPRSRDILTKNNVIALEPKFVIPEVGAVGVENTYIVTDNGLERITNAPERIINLM